MRIKISPAYQRQQGFSLIESLIALSIFSLFLLAGLEFFSSARSHFLRIKADYQRSESAFCALDKIRWDLLEAGRGLAEPLHSGVLEGIEQEDERLVIYSKNTDLQTTGGLYPGQSRIFLQSLSGLTAGKEICVFDNSKGECSTIGAVDTDSIVLMTPLRHQYTQAKHSLILLRKISFYLDANVLRRKVNAAPAQPLHEETESFIFNYTKSANLVTLGLEVTGRKEKRYEVTVFPKNLALAEKY